MKVEITKKVMFEYNGELYETENDAKIAKYMNYKQKLDNKLTECAENITSYNTIDGKVDLLTALIGTLSQKEIDTIRQSYNKEKICI